MSIYRLPRAILRVAGPEAGAFLDALLTADVSRATPEAGAYAALLNPQGKLIADLFAHRAEDGALLLDVAADRAEDLLRRLTMYRLRKPVDLSDVSAAFAVEVHTDAQAGLPANPRRPDGALGARLVTAAPTHDPAPFAAYEAFRIAAGVPDPAIDAAPEEVFGLEALLEELHGVDFQKGCFIGQENVSRMKRRATTRRKFCRITFEGPPIPFGTSVVAGNVKLGDVRSAIDGRAIALLRLDRAREALDAGEALVAEDRTVRLDPPDWLLLPEAGKSEGA
jgi:tRNA-modifying protein YgfZ